MNVSSVGSPASAPSVQSNAVPTLVATQQEAQKEATIGIRDGDEALGNNVNRLA